MRLALFTALPVLLGTALVAFDRTASGPVREAEAFLVPLLIVGVGGNGLSAFIAHVFISEPAARSMGWATGSPFQPMVGFAYLAVAIVGAVAAERRDGFREATVAALAVFGVGVATVHVMDLAATGALTPTGTLPHLLGLVQPAVLVWLLFALRRAERTEQPTILLRSWITPVRRGSVAAVAMAAIAVPLAHTTGQAVPVLLAAMVGATLAFWWIVRQARSHRPEPQDASAS